jgi:hypothetical protein
MCELTIDTPRKLNYFGNPRRKAQLERREIFRYLHRKFLDRGRKVRGKDSRGLDWCGSDKDFELNAKNNVRTIVRISAKMKC